MWGGLGASEVAHSVRCGRAVGASLDGSSAQTTRRNQAAISATSCGDTEWGIG
jgi:hypothetical protein